MKTTELQIMRWLRSRGWIVVLKCIPNGKGWIAAGSRSEYDGPCPDRVISMKPWCAEATYIGRDVIWMGHPWAMGTSPLKVLSSIRTSAIQMMEEHRKRKVKETKSR